MTEKPSYEKLERRTHELEKAEFERQIAIDVMRENNKHQREIIEKSNAGYFFVDREGCFQKVNSAWLRLHKYETADEVIGQHFSLTQVETDLSSAYGIVEDLLASGEIITGDFARRCKDGSIGHHTFSARVVYKQGVVIGLEGFIIDITERKQIEKALRESEERFRSIVDNMADWTWKVDSNGRYTYCSEKVEDILGYSPEDMIGKTPFQFMAPDEAERVGEIFKGIIAKKKPFVDLENWNFTKDGRRVCLLTNGVPLLLENGDLAGFTGVARNITDRMRAEAELKESEEKFRSLAENSQDYIMRYDERGRHLYQNEAGNRVSGFSDEEFIGKTHRELGFNRELCDLWEEGIKRVFKSSKPTGEIFQWESVDGQVTLDWRLFPEFDQDGQVKTVLGISRDITDMRKSEEELKKSHSELETKVKERTEKLTESNKFLKDKITEHLQTERALKKSEHELRVTSAKLLGTEEAERKRIGNELHDSVLQSLGTIKIWAETAQRRIMKGEASGASKALDYLIPIIQTEIEETRRISKNLHPPLLNLGMETALKSFIGDFEFIHKEIVIEQEFNFPESKLPDFLEITIFRVVQEALNNAAKHSKARLIKVNLTKVEDRIELTIQDDGKGFETSSRFANKLLGDGLGLPSMKERVRLSGGEFLFESFPGKGTIVAATWPHLPQN